MSHNLTPFVAYDLETGEPLDFDPLDGNHELEKHVQADESLQATGHRQTAEHGPDLNTNSGDVITEGGFGSGQGMASQSKRHGHVS